MSTGFMPINLSTSVATQDTSYLRQNTVAAKPRNNNSNQSAAYIPNNTDLKAMVKSALDMQSQNISMERGSILNILV